MPSWASPNWCRGFHRVVKIVRTAGVLRGKRPARKRLGKALHLGLAKRGNGLGTEGRLGQKTGGVLRCGAGLSRWFGSSAPGVFSVMVPDSVGVAPDAVALVVLPPPPPPHAANAVAPTTLAAASRWDAARPTPLRKWLDSLDPGLQIGGCSCRLCCHCSAAPTPSSAPHQLFHSLPQTLICRPCL